MNNSAIAKPLSRIALRKMANNLRDHFEIPTDVPFPIVELIELLSSDGQSLNYEVIPDDEMEECYAKALPDQNRMLIKESVYIGACDGNERDRFTLAHELGHILLHSGESISFARTNEKIKAYQNPEWQANTFAAELLVPATIIRGQTPQEICNRYNVSYTVATIQLQHAI